MKALSLLKFLMNRWIFLVRMLEWITYSTISNMGAMKVTTILMSLTYGLRMSTICRILLQKTWSLVRLRDWFCSSK